MNKRFNIRVYGILFNDNNEILVSDEFRWNKFFTKFPGGGLEWGEGLQDCLKREFKEELNLEITVHELFYITDFFVQSAWLETDQIISVYFKIHYAQENNLQFEPYTNPFYNEQERYRWVKWSDITEDLFTFPIDKLVGGKLHEDWLKYKQQHHS
ncbi:MAG: NUDIX hydrolase [Bacteroidia bacterium]|nr:NUDIX hydrolase [Bacteroidia bacterium]